MKEAAINKKYQEMIHLVMASMGNMVLLLSLNVVL